MKLICSIFLAIICLASCQNKTVNLLSKKWDYEKIENVDTTSQRFLSIEDSIANSNMKRAMQLLSWTFKKNMTYECAVGNRIATSGQYAISGNDSTLTMVPSTKGITNTYMIKILTENQLVLSALSNDVIVTMHFRPHD